MARVLGYGGLANTNGARSFAGKAQPTNVEVTFGLSSWLQKEFTASFGLTSVLQGTSTLTFSLSSRVEDTTELTFGLTSHLEVIGLLQVGVSSWIMNQHFKHLLFVASYLDGEATKTFTLTSHIVQPTLFSVFSWLQKTQTPNFGLTSYLSGDKVTVAISSWLKQPDDTLTFSLSSWIQKEQTGTFSLSSWLQDTVLLTFTLSSNIVDRGGIGRSFTVIPSADTAMQVFASASTGLTVIPTANTGLGVHVG